ncbi:MAG: carbohydrate ABC transporter permease [Spirochaetales bacterium]|nr:carbohydrate ABC transporter permease [Spirochaetales bacterium]
MMVTTKSSAIISKTGWYILLIIIAMIFVLPLLFMVVSSLKPEMQLLADTSSLRAFLPVGNLSFDNFLAAFKRAPIPLFLFNSILVTLVTVVLGMLLNSMAAFSFTFLQWKGRNIIMAIIVATFIVPFETIAVPLLLLVNKLPWISAQGLVIGWMNSYHVQIIPFLAYSFQVFLFYQFFREIPKDLVEAARIDGANWLQIYTRVVIPVSSPVIATAAILRSLDMWNQYLWPLMVVQSEKFRPVMIGLQYFFQLDIAWAEIMAYLSIITVPIIIFYLGMQKTFIESIASTGIKG